MANGRACNTYLHIFKVEPKHWSRVAFRSVPNGPEPLQVASKQVHKKLPQSTLSFFSVTPAPLSLLVLLKGGDREKNSTTRWANLAKGNEEVWLFLYHDGEVRDTLGKVCRNVLHITFN